MDTKQKKRNEPETINKQVKQRQEKVPLKNLVLPALKRALT